MALAKKIPKLKKCKYCKQEINETDLVKHQQLDRHRNPKFKLNKAEEKVPVYFYAHRKCHEVKEKQRIAWENLYEYVLAEYFDKLLPGCVVTRLQDLRNGSSRMGRIIQSKQGYSYELILECFQENEDMIDKYISQKSFNSDSQRGNYIMAIIEGNIDGFETKASVEVEKEITKESFFEQLQAKAVFAEKQKSMSFQDGENFDILD